MFIKLVFNSRSLLDQAYENEAKSKTDLDQSKRELIRIQVYNHLIIVFQYTLNVPYHHMFKLS